MKWVYIYIVYYHNEQKYSNTVFIRGKQQANSRGERVKRGIEKRKPSWAAVFQHSRNLLW